MRSFHVSIYLYKQESAPKADIQREKQKEAILNGRKLKEKGEKETWILKEWGGDYLRRKFQVVPDITDAINDWIESVPLIPVECGWKRRVCGCQCNRVGGTPCAEVGGAGGSSGDIELMLFCYSLSLCNSSFQLLCFHISLYLRRNGELIISEGRFRGNARRS